MSVKVAFLQLSDCWGCHQSFLNSDLELAPILPNINIVYWPAVVDFKLESIKLMEDGNIDIGFIEGCIRTNDDEKNAKLFRQKSKFIISFGACACYGNVSGLANLFSLEEQIKRKYVTCETVDEQYRKEPTKNVSGFRNKVNALDDIIKVDAYLNGCPPRSEQILGLIQYLLGQKPFPRHELSFCTDCDIKENCLLKQGILCFGAVTSSGCSLKCTKNGTSCLGCFGPSLKNDVRVTELISMIKKVDIKNKDNKNSIFKFLSLFLNVPLISGFEISNDPLKNVTLKDQLDKNNLLYPPETRELVSILLNILKNSDAFHEISTVCDTCPRTRKKNEIVSIKREFKGIPNQTDCFIDQGYICMGPITKAGCGALCIKVNAQCDGCYGQTQYNCDQVNRFFDKVTHDFNMKITNRDFLNQVIDPIGIFERFTLAKNKNYL